MKLINIGFGNLVSEERLVAIVGPDSAPIKRMVQESRERGMLIDATYGRRTRAVIVMDSDHVILSAVQPEAQNTKRLPHRMSLAQLEGRSAGGGVGQRQRMKAQRLYLGIKKRLRRQIGVGLGQRLIIAQQRTGRPGAYAHIRPVPVHRPHDLIAHPGKQPLAVVLYLDAVQIVQRPLMREGNIQLPRRGVPAPRDNHRARFL